MGVPRLAVANGPNIFQMLLVKTRPKTDSYIGKEDALRLQVDGLAVTAVVEEVFKTQELESTHLTLLFPDKCDRQLTRLQRKTRR